MNADKLEKLFRTLFLVGAIAGGAALTTACEEENPIEEGVEEIGDEIDDAF